MLSTTCTTVQSITSYTVPWSALLGYVYHAGMSVGGILATVPSSSSVLRIIHACLTVFYVSCVCVAQTFLVPIFGNAFRHLFLALCREQAHILGVSTQRDPYLVFYIVVPLLWNQRVVLTPLGCFCIGICLNCSRTLGIFFR